MLLKWQSKENIASENSEKKQRQQLATNCVDKIQVMA